MADARGREVQQNLVASESSPSLPTISTSATAAMAALATATAIPAARGTELATTWSGLATTILD